MKNISLIHLFLIFFSWCILLAPTVNSPTLTDRSIASSTAPNSQTIKKDLETILDFKFLNKTRDPKETLEKLKKIYVNTDSESSISYFIFKDASRSLPDDLSFRIVPKIINDQYVLEIQYTQKGLSDSAAAIELDSFIKQFIKHHYSSTFHFFELYYNALNGDGTSMHTMAQLKREAYVTRSYIQNINPEMEKIVEVEFNKIKNLVAKYSDFEKVQKTQIRLNRQKRLAQFTIDQKNLAPTFKALVAKNDRIGTANLLEKILPWEIMQPLEKKMFKDHLMYMKNHLPLEKRILLFRGIDKNTIFLDANNQPGAKTFDAIYSSQIFLFSHFLDSKKLTQKEFDNYHHTPFLLDINSKKSNKYQRATPITSYFLAHAKDSFNSMFLSTSSDLGIAANFGRDRLAMLAVDPRMAYANFISALKPEKEYLIPFFIFPDEILSTIQYSYDLLYLDLKNKTAAEVQSRLLDAYYRKFSKSLSQIDAENLFNKIKQNTAKYDDINFNRKKSLMGPQLDSALKTVIKSENIFINSPLKPKFNPRSCLEIMTMFNAI